MMILISTAFFNIELIKDLRLNQEIAFEVNELNRIPYRLLSASQWASEVSSILAEKIDRFEINKENRAEVRQKISQMLLSIIDELDTLIRKRNRSGNTF